MEKIWEKREDETAKAFRAFTVYRDMNPSNRNCDVAYAIAYKKDIEKHRKGIKRAAGFFRQWSIKYEWVKRVGAWDKYCDQQDEENRLETWKEFKNNIIKYNQGLLAKGAERIYDISPSEIPANVLSKWMLDMMKAMADICQIEGGDDDEKFIVEEARRVYASGRDLVSDVITRFSETEDDSAE